MEVGKALRPAKLEIVFAHYAAIGGSALAKINFPVGPDRRAVGVMVAMAREFFYQGRASPIGGDAQPAAALKLTPLRHKESVPCKGNTGPRPVTAARGDFSCRAV